MGKVSSFGCVDREIFLFLITFLVGIRLFLLDLTGEMFPVLDIQGKSF